MDKYLGGVRNSRILSLALGVRYSRLLRQHPEVAGRRSGQAFYRTAPEHPLMVDVRHPERYRTRAQVAKLTG